MRNFQKQMNAQSANESGLVKLISGTVSAAATLDIVMTSYTAYKNKLLVFNAFLPATTGTGLQLRTSSNGGSSYDSAGTDYQWAGSRANQAGTLAAAASNGADSIPILAGSTSVDTAGLGASGSITLYDTTDTATRTRVDWNVSYENGVDGFTSNHVSGHRDATGDVDAIRLYYTSGNIASGTWTLYGYR